MDRQVPRTCSVHCWQVREPNCLVPDVGRAKCSGLAVFNYGVYQIHIFTVQIRVSSIYTTGLTSIRVPHGKIQAFKFPSTFSSNFPLFLFQIAVHIYYTIDLKDNNSYGPMPWRDGWGAQYSPLIYTPARRHEAWRFLSYMFIHLYHWHLVSNIIMQLILGIPLEMVHGSLRVGIVYCIGVIAGKRSD